MSDIEKQDHEPVDREYIEAICALEDAETKIWEIRKRLEAKLSSNNLLPEEIQFIELLKKGVAIMSEYKVEEDQLLRTNYEELLDKLPAFKTPE